MFEVIRYRKRGELTYYYAVIPCGAAFSTDAKRDLNPELHRFGPFLTKDEAREFIEEVERDTSDTPLCL